MSDTSEPGNADEPRLWDHPAPEDNKRFKPFIQRSGEPTPHFVPKKCSYGTWSNPPNPLPYASFGDDGVTASVNSKGDLIQFSTYLGTGTSGMFCVDQSGTPEPWLVKERMDKLLQLGRSQAPIDYGMMIPYHDSENISETDDFSIYEEEGDKDEEGVEMSFVHDRWPRYEYDCVDKDLRIMKQWMVHNKTVLQQCRIMNSSESPKTLSLRFRTGMHIRDLEFANVSNTFNEDRDGHIHKPGPNGYSWILCRFCEEKNQDEPEDRNSRQETRDAVAVVVTVFVDGKAVQWTDLYSSSGPSIKFVDLKDIPIEVNDDVEVVTAYKMLSLPALGNRSWEPFLISPGEANVGHLLERESSFFRAELFSLFPPELDMKLVTDEPMDSIPQGPGKTSKLLHYLMRRNLWHILSVCSIPIPSNDDTLGFALTCGDISGHRVHTSATFFAFSFLLEFMKLITKKFGPLTEADNTYVDYIREKIMTVCRGHLEWLLRAKKTSKGSFAANYWVTGSLVNIDQYPPFTLNDALTDTAFQIIKFFQFDDIEKSDSDSPRRQDILKIAQEWMAGLAKLDRRKKCVWPRSNVEGCDKYRLSDHIWIWRASKAREALTRRSKGNPRPQDESLEGLGNRLKDANEILKRFIALNDVSSKRMISTTRSPRESRFLLHGGDTALLHALDSELFAPESPFYSPWHNTLQAQSYHVDSSEAGWDNSATYALAMMLGMKGRSIGKASPLDMVIQSLGILFGTTDSHGLFFGQIDEISKKPSLFKGESDKDWYFQVGFEIPFILLTQWSNIHLALSLHEQSQKESREDPAKLHEKTELAAMPHTLGSGYLSSDTTYDRFQKDLSRNKFQSEQTNSWTMKKYMPFTYHIDQSSIVDLADEWLYNYPTFLTRDEPIDFKKEADSLREECDMGTNIGLVVAKACRDRLPNQASLTFLLNVPKKKKESQKRNKGTVNYNIYPQKADGDAELQDLLGEARSPDEAKKRFIWLKRAFPSTALVCTLSSSAEEVQALSQFFDRHSHYDNYFIDDVSMVLNTWETELHLSFYQLWPPNQPLNLPEGIPEPISIAVPREPESQIIRNSVSFRFQGDFFDRYWTCHLVEFIPFSTAERFHHSFHPGTSEKTFGEQGCLQQRKVLELHLLDRFLKILVKSTKGIFENVQNRHSEDFNYQRATSETYFTSIAHWQDDMDILQRVEKEVLEALLVIEKWETREKDRGQERPRWTRNDESKYRPFIRKLEASTHRGTRDLRLYHNSIKSLRERLATNQERIRNDLSLRGAENIRFFTYVTVVFLPLGFAASIFSMNGAPSGETLGSVVAFAAIALVLTIVALINAKSLTTVMISIRDAIDSKSQEKMTISSLAHHDISDDGGSHVETITGDQESGNATIEAPSTHTSSSRGEHLPKKGAQHHKESKHYHGDHSWHIWFWLRYMCLVFPARRVLIACNKLKNPKPAKLTTYTHIFYGVVMLPTFLIFQLAYIIVCNFADLGQVCLNSLRGVLHSQYLDKKEEIEIQKQLDRLNRSQGRYRPLCHKLNNEEDTGR